MENNIVQLDLTGIKQYSYSRLSSYDNCPYGYLLNYIERKRNKQNGFSVAGEIPHNLINDFYKGKYSDYELSEAFEQAWQKEFIDKNWKVKLYLPNYTKDITSNYYNSFLDYFLYFSGYDCFEVIDTEIEYAMLLEKDGKRIIFTGIVDCLGLDENKEIILFDSKSKGKFKNQDEIDAYAKQLYCYCIFIKEVYGKFPKLLCFNQFRLPENQRTTKIEFNIDDYNKAIDWIFNTVDKIENENLWLPNYEEEFFCNNLCGQSQNCSFYKRDD